MKDLYEALIGGVDGEARVCLAVRGRWQAYVETEDGAGLSSLLLPGKIPYDDALVLPEWEGRPLRELAGEVRRFEGIEAALGMAALNAWYNAPARLEGRGVKLFPPEVEGGHAFRTLEAECRDKIVSTVGHFHGGEALRGMKELRVFEKDPRPGDYPEEREEELLPGSDIVIITGMAFTNGTMPRLLELTEGCYTALSGPTVPMAEALFDWGVDALFGTVVWDVPGCREAILTGGHKDTWPHMGKTEWRKG